MSNRYKGGVISATPPTTTGGNDGVASGAWTLEQQMQLQAAGLWPNQPVFYIEDVFSTYLWTGNASTQTITNGINLSTKGGLVWIKRRDGTDSGNYLATTVDGTSNYLQSNTTGAYETSVTTRITSFNADGFSLGAAGSVNSSGALYVGWTFREQPKFFDIVTYTGDGINNRAISHNLGSTPGCIMFKATNALSDWIVYHRSLGQDFAADNIDRLRLNSTAGQAGVNGVVNDVSSTTFTLGNNSASGAPNDNGTTYIAYLWAHDAGGFGLTGTDNVISCGSFTTDGSGNATVSLGYEPQWVMFKASSSVERWFVNDIMRGMPAPPSGSGTNVNLFPNSTAVESIEGYDTSPTSTGFDARTGNPSRTYIYIAIRRGPMAVPTLGTNVFTSVAQNFSSSATTVTTGFPVDLNITASRNRTVSSLTFVFDRLRGLPLLTINSPAAESTPGGSITFASNTSVLDSFWGPDQGASGQAGIYWNWRRAPSFFDEVCYTGNSTDGLVVNHNLGVVPELVIFKKRTSSTGGWPVWTTSVGTGTSFNYLNSTAAVSNQAVQIFTSSPTSTTMTLASFTGVNNSGTMVAYLFATCAGVSKVGSYTGTGAAQTINCGFTSGARFVLIKRTDSTGDWNVWDSARGIIPSNDPYLTLNSTAAEVTGTDYVDTTSVGFDITSTAPADINANGGTYIFLAIA